MDTTQTALAAQAPVVARLREIATKSRSQFEDAQVALSDHALNGFQLREGVIEEYAYKFAALDVFESALAMTDSAGIVDLAGVRRWNHSRVVSWRSRGSGIERLNREAEHHAHISLMRVLEGEV